MTQSSLRFSNNWARHLQPSLSLCLFLCLHSSAWITDPASQLPSSWPAPDSAVGGQICLALSMICEFPVHGPTCQIKPTPAPSCRAAGIWEVLHPDLVPGLIDTHLLAAGCFSPGCSECCSPLPKPCLLSVLLKKGEEKASLLWRLALQGLNYLLNSENLFFNGYSFFA